MGGVPADPLVCGQPVGEQVEQLRDVVGGGVQVSGNLPVVVSPGGTRVRWSRRRGWCVASGLVGLVGVVGHWGRPLGGG